MICKYRFLLSFPIFFSFLGQEIVGSQDHLCAEGTRRIEDLGYFPYKKHFVNVMRKLV